ncbi:MAG TPA: tetratricopeptide repeat protein [Armatimonadota bacterium]|nr:tetratricopeptide repeat protein [Armatimonadota bacterium]
MARVIGGLPRWLRVSGLLAAVMVGVFATHTMLMSSPSPPEVGGPTLSRLASALDGQCLHVVDVKSPFSWDIEEWLCVMPDSGPGQASWAHRLQATGEQTLALGFVDGARYAFDPPNESLLISSARSLEWPNAWSAASRLVAMLDLDAANDPQVEDIGADTYEGHACRVFSVREFARDWDAGDRDKRYPRLLWWIDTQTDLPVVSCLYDQLLTDPQTSLPRARVLLDDPGSWVHTYETIPPPDRAFFELAELPAKTTIDLRSAQHAAVATAVDTHTFESLQVTVHPPKLGREEIVSVPVSAKQLPPVPEATVQFYHRVERLELPLDQLPWNKRAQARRAGAVSMTVAARVPLRSAAGREYFARVMEVFSHAESDVAAVILVPLEPGEPPDDGDEISVPLSVCSTLPPLMIETGAPKLGDSQTISLRIPLPVSGGSLDTVPDWVHEPSTVDRLRHNRAAWAASSVRRNAESLRDVGRFDDALASALRADELYAQARAGNPAVLRPTRSYFSRLIGDIYADMGDVPRAREYLARAREQAEKHETERYRRSGLVRVDRTLAYLDTLEQ